MSILQIELPDEQLQLLSKQARAQGYKDNAEYVSVLLQKLVGQDELVNSSPTPEQLERESRLLLQAADSPRTPSTPELWAQLRAELGGSSLGERGEIAGEAARFGVKQKTFQNVELESLILFATS